MKKPGRADVKIPIAMRLLFACGRLFRDGKDFVMNEIRQLVVVRSSTGIVNKSGVLEINDGSLGRFVAGKSSFSS